jgi:hypothetical protein
VLTLIGSLVLCCGLVVQQYAGVVRRHDAGLVPMATPVPIIGSAVLLADGVTVLYSDPAGSCRGPLLSAQESADRVVLVLSETDVSGLAWCARGGPNGANLRLSVQVQLATPLGSRPLIDQVTGAVVPYFNMRHGLSMPGGPVDSVYFTQYQMPNTNASYFGGPGAGVLAQSFGGFDGQGHPSPIAWIELIQVTGGGGWHPPPNTVTTPVTVRGHAGRAAAGIIVWEESGLTIGLVGAGPAPSGATSYPMDGPPLSTDVLVTIASELGERPP